MNKLQKVFNYGQMQVRTVIIDGEPWFIASDVCSVLEINNSAMATSRLDSDEKGISTIDTLGGPQEVCIINEPGLYSLILTSRKPEAKQFKRWITHEVLPSIRKVGSYNLNENLNIPKTYSEALRALADKYDENQKLLPKAEQYDRFMSGDNSQTMNVVAKCAGVGRNKLFELLRQERILMSNNTPYSEFMARGYFEVKERPINIGGVEINVPQTFVTAKGVDYIMKLLAKKNINKVAINT